MQQPTQPLLMDVTPLPQEVDVVAFLLDQVGQLRFDPSDPQAQLYQQQAVATWRRLNAMQGKVTFTTADRILLYALGRAVEDAELARTLGSVLDEIRRAHGPAAAPAKTIAELATEAAAAAAAAPDPKPPTPAKPTPAKPPAPAVVEAGSTTPKPAES